MSTYEYVGSNTPDGMTLGYGTSNKAGFHGSTCTQAAAITHVATTGAATGGYGFTTASQADALRVAVNSILTALENKGIISA